MPKKGEHAPGGVCEKLFSAFSIGPVIRPLRSLTFRQQQDPKDRVAGPVEAAAAPPAPRLQSGGKVDIEYVSDLTREQRKDIDDKVEDYINQTKIKFQEDSHYVQ